MEVLRTVVLSKLARKQLARLPAHIADALLTWVDDVEQRGLEEVRKVPGHHDEPLKGARRGERSIRLNRGWRAIYVLQKDQILVKEVTHHDY